MSIGTEDGQVGPATGDAKEAAPSRMRVLLRRPGRLIIALALMIVAVLVAVFTTATFTSSSANAGNMVAAGDLTINNGLDGAAIFNVSGLVPGDSAQGTVTISNVGSAAGNFSLTTQNLTDTPASPPFSGYLDLTIQDVTDAGNPVSKYNGKMNAVGTIQLGKWNAGSSHTYKITATFPNGTPAQDNQFKKAKTTVDFVWNAVS